MSTLRDVARAALVSVSTASRFVRQDGYVSPAAAQRIGEAMRHLGYRPNGVARSLRGQRTRTLALVVPEIENPFFTTVSRGVEDVANAAGYAVIFCNTDENDVKQARYLGALLERKIDGILLVPCGAGAAEQCHMLVAAGEPFVLIDREVEGVNADAVVGDNCDGALRLTGHLLALGHRRIGFVGGNPLDSVSRQRREGYRAALADAGLALDPLLVREGDWSVEAGWLNTRALLQLTGPPTALFCANNLLAVGALAALREARRRVPEDVALVCFEDIELASLLDPWLTVAVQPAMQMGIRAATMLLERLSAPAAFPPAREVLPVQLTVRRSCGSAASQETQAPSSGWVGRQWRAADSVSAAPPASPAYRDAARAAARHAGPPRGEAPTRLATAASPRPAHQGEEVTRSDRPALDEPSASA